MDKPRPTAPALLTIFITVVTVLALVAAFAGPVTAGITTSGDSSTSDDLTPPDDILDNETVDDQDRFSGVTFSSDDDGYGPDYDIPSNNFRIFYSDTEPHEHDEEEEEEDDDEIEFDDPDLGEPRDIEEIEDDARSSDAAEDYSEAADMSYLITPSLMEIYGWTLSDYRTNQVEAIDFDPEESPVLEPWEDETEDDGVIEEAYVGIVGINSGAEPRFETPGDYDKMVSDNGELLTYLDFKYNEDEIPDEEKSDVETIDGGDTQVQERWTYHIEDTEVDRYYSYAGDTVSSQYRTHAGEGATGLGIEYTDTLNQESTQTVTGEIEASIHEYHWERTRDRIYESRHYRVSASTSTSTTASTFASTIVHHGPDSEGEELSEDVSRSCSARTSDTATTTVEDDFTRLGGDRTIEIDEEVDIDVSGSISGTCSGTITGTAGSGNFTRITGTVSDTISGEISGSDTVEIEYDYWDHWDSEANTDDGGWEYQNDELHRTDDVTVRDSIDVLITDNNDPPNVDQVAIEVEEDQRYHVLVDVDYPHHWSGYNMSVNDLDDQYLWSMLMFGENTYIETDWKAYSYTRYDDAGLVGTCTEGHGRSTTTYECYDDRVDFPNQLGVYLFSEDSGPNLVSTGEGNNYNTKLEGWLGDYITSEDKGVHENAQFHSDQPVVYTDFVIRNAPSPATSMISVHGDEHELDESDVDVVPYAEPSVSIQETRPGSDIYEIEVTGEDGEPLPGRTVRVSGATDLGSYTTNDEGKVFVDVGSSAHLHVEVPGDNVEDFMGPTRPDVYYGSVNAEKTIGIPGVVGHLYDAIMQLIFAIPLVLLYLLWRDGKLGI